MSISLSQAVTLCRAHSASATNIGRAVGIMWAESKLDPAATCHNCRDKRTGKITCGTPNTGNYGPLISTDRGIWMINDHWHKEVTDAQCFDPTQATSAAFHISGGFTDFHQWATAPLLTSDPHVSAIVKLATQEAQAQLAGEKGPSPLTAATSAVGGAMVGGAGAVVDGVGGVVNATMSLGEFLSHISERSTWMRVVEVIGGAACIVVGAFMLDRSLMSQVAGTAVTNVAGGLASKVGASAVASGSFRPS